MIRGESECRDSIRLAELRNVFDLTVQHDPTDSCNSCGARHLGQGRASRRFEDNSCWLGLGARLDYIEKLLALRDGVIVGMNDFQFDTAPSRRRFSGSRLLNLVIVVVIRK